MVKQKARRQGELLVGAVSHKGLVRAENQDRQASFQALAGDIFAVADGMGGHLDGGRAAELTLEVVEKSLSAQARSSDFAEALRQAASAASQEVCREATKLEAEEATEAPSPNPSPTSSPATKRSAKGARMGSTLVLVHIHKRRATVAHAGDSRAYLYRRDRLSALTKDHTVVQRMLDHGILSPTEARNHPDSGIITRAIGQAEQVDLEVADLLYLEENDRLLLCSDGLCAYVEDTVLAEVLGDERDPQRAAEKLLEKALGQGGEDNITVLVVELAPEPTHSAKDEPSQQGWRTWSLGPLGGRGLGAWLGIALALAGAAVWIGFLLRYR